MDIDERINIPEYLLILLHHVFCLPLFLFSPLSPERLHCHFIHHEIAASRDLYLVDTDAKISFEDGHMPDIVVDASR